MGTRFFSTLALAVLAAPLSAQNFNVDFGEIADQPSAPYAAAGLPGYWNSIRAVTNHHYTLKDMDGNFGFVDLYTTGSSTPITSADPSVTGDDAALMNDGAITYNPNADLGFYFDNLATGPYEVTVYAWRPDYPTQMAKSYLEFAPGTVPEDSGGAWPGGHVEGVTYSRFTVNVNSTASINVRCGFAASTDPLFGVVCNGIQLRRIEEQTPICFGDGSAGACPCNNNGAPGHGCENSSSTGGALFTSSGTTVPDTVVLSVTGEKPTALTIFLQASANGPPLNFGDGLRCIHDSLKRLYVRNANGGAVSVPQSGDPGIQARSGQLGDFLYSGQVRYYMTYYRDSVMSFCPSGNGGTFNGSNAVSIRW